MEVVAESRLTVSIHQLVWPPRGCHAVVVVEAKKIIIFPLSGLSGEVGFTAAAPGDLYYSCVAHLKENFGDSTEV